MNVEEITKKLEEIRADAFDRASSHDEQSKTQLEDYNRVELDEDVAGEDVKLERTKGKDSPAPKTLSRTTSMDGGKGPKEDIYVNDATLKAPTIDELQSKLDSLNKYSDPRISSQNETKPMNFLREIESRMDVLLVELQAGELSKESYVRLMKPLLDNMKELIK